MEIEDTPLYKEASIIMRNGQTSANVGWSALIHYGKEVLKPLNVISVNYVRDYANRYADVSTVTLQMGLGTYSRLVYPNRLDLHITLTKSPMGEVGNEVDGDAQIQSERFKMILISDDKSPTVAQGAESNDIEALNLTQIVDIHFQFYDDALEQLRVQLTGGIYRTTSVQDALKTILTTQGTLPVVDGAKAILGVSMIDADNKDKKGQIIITHGTPILDVADYLQARVGIYNSGLGSYIQNKYWYVYPLYDTTEFTKRLKTLSILVLPKRKYSNIERTYKVVGNAVTVLVTGDTEFKDDNGTNFLSRGNGVRFTDAAKVMDNGTSTGNKTKIERKQQNNEYSGGTAVGVPNAPVAADRITANPFIHYSAIASRNGGMIQLVWENSDSSIISPGMATKITYTDGDATQILYGIVHRSTQVSHRYGGIGNNKFKNQTVMQIFVNSQVTDISA